MKKFFILSLLILLPSLLWATEVTIDGIYYNLISKTGTAEVIAGDNKYTGSVVIPAKVTYEGTDYTVTAIGEKAFYECSSLTSVTIPSSVTSIGSGAFSNCYTLTSFSVPNSVTTIGSYAFEHCYGLTSVNIPNSVTTIGSNAFSHCQSITSIIIPESVTSIGGGAFSNCSSLTSIVIPNSVSTFGDYIFSACTSLTEVSLPNNLTSIPIGIFSKCSKLKSIDIPNSVTTISNRAFQYCSQLTDIDIPDGVTSIRPYAFDACTSLTSIVIPNSVTSISSYAFRACTSLKFINIPDHVTKINISTFSGCTSLESIVIPDSVKTIDTDAFSGCSALTSVTIGSSIQKINSNAFANCQELTDVYCYAETVPTTNATAFNNSYIDYATLYVPEAAIESYKASAPWSGFKEIKSISSVESDEVQVDGISYLLDKSENTAEVIRSLGDAYSGDVVIPESIVYNGTTYSVTSIGMFAFGECRNLTTVDLPSTLTVIDGEAFTFCSSLSTVTIPENVTTIGVSAFSYCSNLVSVIIPNSVTSIGMAAFSSCTSLTTLTIGSGISSMSFGVFEGCTSLQSVTVMRETPASIHGTVFNDVDKTTCVLHVPYGCKSAYESAEYWSEFTNILEADFIYDGLYYSLDFSAKTAKVIRSRGEKYSGSVHIPTSITYNDIQYAVTAVGDSAFYGCNNLKYFTIDEGVTTIGDYSFADSGVLDAEFPSTLTTIGKSAFLDCGNMEAVFFPKNLTTIGSYAFYACTKLETVTIPSGVTIIDKSVFSCCYGLTTVNLPEGVIEIRYHAFRGCGSLPSIVIPNSVTTIGEGAFEECGDLTTITIPSNVTQIDKLAFQYCNGLTTVNIEDLSAWCKINFGDAKANPLYYAHHLYMDGVEVMDLVIPDGVESVGNFAFNRCTSLTSLTIPQSVTSIGASAFAGCSGLSSITAEGETPATIQSTTFTSVSKTNCTLYVPYGCQTAYASASYWSEFENIVEMENSDPDTDISTLDEALYIEAMEGRVGGTMDLSIKLKSTEAARGFQFILEVPEGVTINGWALSENRLPTGATTNNKISSFKIDGNKITVACTLNYGSATFTGNDGEVATVNVTFGGDMTEGTYSLFLTDCGYSNAAGNDLLLEDVNSSVTLESYLVGDANGDSLVRIGDVTAILNYIIGKVPEGFNAKAADANEDGQIRIGDVTTVLNIIMGL